MVNKIAIFGGTGMTGQSVVEYALQKGMQISCCFFLLLRFAISIRMTFQNCVFINRSFGSIVVSY